MPIPCYHCQEASVLEVDGKAFCCPGCAAAYAWLEEAGLSPYYQLREDLAEANLTHSKHLRTPAQTLTRTVTRTGPRDYQYLDDENTLNRLGHRNGACNLHVVGMHCAACMWLIEKLPEAIPGLQQCRVDLSAGQVFVVWDPQRVPLSKIAETLERLGYSVHLNDEAAAQAYRKRRRRDLFRLTVAGASAGNTMMIAIALYAGDASIMNGQLHRFMALASALTSLPAISYGAWPFYRAAWQNLKQRRLHLDFPISLGVISAYLFSGFSLTWGSGILYFDTLATLIFLLLVSRFVQQQGQQWALSQGGALHLLLPPTAYKRRPPPPNAAQSIFSDPAFSEATIAVSSLALEIGDIIVVKPDQRIAADGRVLRGRSHVDASSWSGEAQAIAIEPGSTVLAGTTNLTETIEIEVQAVGEQTQIGSLSQKLGQNHLNDQKRSPLQSLVDRISRRFAIAVLLTATAGGCLWWWIDPSRIFEVVLSILVVTCPCALGMATPLALLRARAQAAERGFVLARASALEDLAQIKTFAFDKTGTLTTGHLEVKTLWSDRSPQQLAPLIAALERESTHPIARCLLRWSHSINETQGEDHDRDQAFDYQNQSPSNSIGLHVQEQAGQGIVARDPQSGETLRLGRFDDQTFQCHFARFPHRQAIQDSMSQGYGETIVCLENSQKMLAVFALTDTPRPGASEIIRELEQRGIRCILLSGDHPDTVATFAKHLGIAEAEGGLSPSDKLHRLAQHPKIAMVGDGVNDAPALQAADVGIAMGASAQIAMRVADIYVPSTRLQSLSALLRGSRASVKMIRRNLKFALLYNLICSSLAMANLVTPLIAALLMPISSLTVISMSMFARPFSSSKKM